MAMKNSAKQVSPVTTWYQQVQAVAMVALQAQQALQRLGPAPAVGPEDVEAALEVLQHLGFQEESEPHHTALARAGAQVAQALVDSGTILAHRVKEGLGKVVRGLSTLARDHSLLIRIPGQHFELKYGGQVYIACYRHILPQVVADSLGVGPRYLGVGAPVIVLARAIPYQHNHIAPEYTTVRQATALTQAYIAEQDAARAAVERQEAEQREQQARAQSATPTARIKVLEERIAELEGRPVPVAPLSEYMQGRQRWVASLAEREAEREAQHEAEQRRQQAEFERVMGLGG